MNAQFENYHGYWRGDPWIDGNSWQSSGRCKNKAARRAARIHRPGKGRGREISYRNSERIWRTDAEPADGLCCARWQKHCGAIRPWQFAG